MAASVTGVTGIDLGPHPFDDDDMTPDIVRSVLVRRLGEFNPSVDVLTADIVQRLRAYDMHRLGGSWITV